MGRQMILAVALCLGCNPHYIAAADLSAPVIPKTVRLDFAKRILADVTRLSDLVPLPQPSEILWVDAESAEIDKLRRDSPAYGSRLASLNERPEFKHIRLHNFLKEVKSSLDCVLKPGVSLQREMYCWGVAAYLLGDRRVFAPMPISDLQQSDRVSKDASILGTVAMYEHYSRDIYEKVVIRYLGGKGK